MKVDCTGCTTNKLKAFKKDFLSVVMDFCSNNFFEKSLVNMLII